MDEQRENFEIARFWARPKPLSFVWCFRLSTWTVVFVTAAVVADKYFEVRRAIIAVGLIIGYIGVFSNLPLGVGEWQRKIAVLIQTILLFLVVWAPIVWLVGFSGEMSPETLKSILPGGKSGQAMLNPDGELIERHKYRSASEAIGDYVGKPIAMGIMSWPLLALSAVFLKRFMIVWYGVEPLLIAAALFRIGGDISALAFIAGISAYAARKPILPTSTLVVVVICAVIFYSLAWLANPYNLHKIFN